MIRSSAITRLTAAVLGAMVVVCILGSTAAQADHLAGGTYTGTHADGGSVTIRISADGRGVISFAAENFRTSTCGRQSYGVRYQPSPLPIVSHAFDDRDPAMLSPRGAFMTGGLASGSFTFTDPDQPACRTNGPITWQAATSERAPAVVAPTAPPVAVPPPATGVGGHQFSGELTVEGDPAVTGFTVIARIGDEECGRSRTTTRGRYAVTVAAGAQTRGCGIAGSSVTLAVMPPSGDAWRFGQRHTFQPGGPTRADLHVDLTRLDADAGNVPLHNQVWREPGAILIAPCGDVSDATLDAAVAAVAMWQEAARGRGLVVGLDPSGDACRDDVASIVIGEVDWPDRRNAIGAQSGIGWDGVPCARNPERTCEVYTSFVLLNRASRSLSPALRANTLAHEIGHALGLEHAHRCSGGTIMYTDTTCLYPMRLIGVDDIAALNGRYGSPGVALFQSFAATGGEDAIKGERGIASARDHANHWIDRDESPPARLERTRADTSGKQRLIATLRFEGAEIVWEETPFAE